MLFHTWTFLVFLLVVLPIFFLLRRTNLWLPWLLAASYFFYGWWNPYYLLLVIYSTALDYLLVALMDHCPPREGAAGRRLREGPRDRFLWIAWAVALLLGIGLGCSAWLAPPALRPTSIAF